MLWAFSPLASLPANYQRSYTHESRSVRTAIFANYDKTSPPESSRVATYSKAGADVALQLRFFKVDEITVSEGSMRLKVWWRQRWTDTRLAWDPAEFGNITQVTISETEPWLPDLTHYNSRAGLKASFESTGIILQHSGSMFWSRPGILDVMCKFSGLVNFPRDELACVVEVGGCARSGIRTQTDTNPSGSGIRTQAVLGSECRRIQTQADPDTIGSGHNGI